MGSDALPSSGPELGFDLEEDEIADKLKSSRFVVAS